MNWWEILSFFSFGFISASLIIKTLMSIQDDASELRKQICELERRILTVEALLKQEKNKNRVGF